MSKTRTSGRFVAASVLTGLFGVAVTKAYTERGQDDPRPRPPVRQVAVAAGILTALTWVAAVL